MDETRILQNIICTRKFLKKIKYIYNNNKTTDIILHLTSDEYMLDSDDIIIRFNSSEQVQLMYFGSPYEINLTVSKIKTSDKECNLYLISDETDGRTVIEFLFNTYEIIS